MGPNPEIGDIYKSLIEKDEIYVYLGNNRIYCCCSLDKRIIGKVFQHPSYINWLRNEFLRIR